MLWTRSQIWETVFGSLIEKENDDLITIERSMNLTKMNKNSELILKQKMEREVIEKINNNPQNDEYDLWPVNMQKNYFEK